MEAGTLVRQTDKTEESTYHVSENKDIGLIHWQEIYEQESKRREYCL